MRVVNVVDLMTLFPPELHPHGMDDATVRRAVHRGQAGRLRVPRLSAGHPRDRRTAGPTPSASTCAGSRSRGTTTTPFDMVVLNGMSRYHLAAEALRRVPRMAQSGAALIDECAQQIAGALAYSAEHLEDAPEIRDWVWTA